jgi:VCBS repeat-containing protein
MSFFAYDPLFAGGVHVAAGDVNGDGRADIVTGAGAGGGPHVKAFDGMTGVEIRSFFAYDPLFAGGVQVGAGDVNGDGRADIVTGAGPGGGPHVKVFDGVTGGLLMSFFAYDPAFLGGVFVGAPGEIPLRIISDDTVTFRVGTPGTFTVEAIGTPPLTLGITGGLPGLVTFTDHGDGTGTLAGTPVPGTGGIHPLTVTATDAGGTATQAFTLQVEQGPAITSGNAATFLVGQAGSFTVTTTGFPAPSLARGGVALPSGVTFVDNGTGTGTLAGTPGAGTGGSYAITFTASNVAGTTPAQAFTLTVQGPPIVNAATFSVAENSANGTVVGTVTFTDPDPGQTHTFSITGGNTNTAFAINAGTGQLTVATSGALDFETTPSFSLTVQVTDNGAPPQSGSATITVTVTNVNEAPVVSPAAFSLPENSANGTLVGTPVTYTDPDAGQTHTFSITAGNTGGAFAINGSTGQITVASSAALNFETTPSFSLTVRVTDNGAPSLFGSATVTVNLTDVNDAPVVSPATFSLPESSANGTLVGTVTFTDPDPGQSHTFSLTGGNTGGAFAINGSTGQITVASSAALNFETTPSFSLTVRVTDNGAPPLFGSATVTINLTDVNEAPVVSPATFSLPENSANGTLVGTVTFTDPDAGQTHTFSITAGNTNTAFAINAGTGQLTVNNSAALDFETTPSFSLTVRVTDNGTPSLFGSATITVNLTDVNEAPVVSPATFSLPENSANGTVVGTVTFTDPDAGQTHIFSIFAGNTGGAFAINASTGQLTVATSGALDFETTPTFSLTVRVTDNGSPILFGSATITVNLTNVNDAPVAQSQSESTGEDTPKSITLTATDQDSPLLTFTIVSPPAHGGLSAVVPVCVPAGAGATCTAAVLYTPTGNYNGPDSFTFKANDGSLDSNVATITIMVNAAPDVPVAHDQTVSVAEDTPKVITLSGTDPDGDSLTFALATGPSQGSLGSLGAPACTTDVNGVSTCTADVTYTPALNYSGPDSFTFTVSDGGPPSAPGTVTINVIAGNDPPVADDKTETTAEDTPKTVTLSATDVDTTSLTFSVATGPTHGSLDPIGAVTCVPDGLGGATCTADVLYTPAPDYNGDDSFTYQANDGLVDSAAATVSITVTASNDAPTAADQSVTTNEDTAKVITLGGSDVDSPSLTFTVGAAGHGTLDTSAAVNCVPAGNGTTCTKAVTYTPDLNYNGPDSFTFTVNDGSLTSAPGTVSITVNQVNDAPVVDPATFSIAENTANGTNVGSPVTFTDPDAGQTHTFSITAGNTGGAFTINGSSGQITVANSAAVDFETTPTFSLTVKVEDNGTPILSGTATITINLTDANDAPVLTAGGTLSYTENQAATAIDPGVTVTDTDSPTLASATVQITGTCTSPQDVLGFTPQSGITGVYTAASCLMTLTGSASPAAYQTALRSVTYQNTSDNPATAPRTVTWIANDGTALSLPVTSTITVTAVNDAPVVTAGGVLSYTENQAATAIDVGLTVTDADSANLVGGTVQITGNCASPQDVLGFTPQSGIVGVYTPASCLMTLSGSASVASYQTALRSVTYQNTSENPSAAPRAVTWQVNDGAGANNLSTPVTSTITVTPVNDAPAGVTDHAHAVTGNVRIQVAAGSGLLVGVTDVEGNAFAPQVDGSSTHVGDITLNPDGSYVYNPKAGHGGADVVKFKVCDDGVPSACSAVHDLTLTVSDMLWFIDNSLGAAGDGRLTSPFNTIAGFTGINDGVGDHPATGEVVFIDRNTVTDYTGPLTLQNNQKVLGKGGTVGLASFAGIVLAPDSDPLPATSGTAPNLTTSVAATNAVTVASGNTLRGFTIGNKTGVGIAGTGIGTLTVSEMSISGTGQALDLTNGNLAATFTTLSSTSGTNNIVLSAGAGTLTGTLTASAGALSGATSRALDINGGTATITYPGTIANTGAGIRVQNKTGGTVTLSGTTKTLNTGANPAVTLSSNTGATINFTNGGLDIDTTSGAGFSATGGGTVTVTGSNNTINSTSATALNVVSTTIGASGLNFLSISAGNNTAAADPANGIVLNTTGSSGGLTVAGDGGVSNNGSGGTIQNTTAEGVLLSNVGAVSLNYMNITNPGTDGIRATTLNNGLTVSRVNIDDSSGTAPADKAIDIGDFVTGTPVNGTINITNSVIGPAAGNSPHDSLAIGISSGTSTWNITGTTFRRTGNSGINMELRGSSVVTAFIVDNCTFAGANVAGSGSPSARGIFANTLDDAVMTLFTIQNNTFTNNNIHIDLNQQNDTDPVGSHTFKILNNTTMTGARSHAVNIFAAAGSFGGTFTGTIEGNTIGNAGVAESGSAIGNGIRVNINGGSDATMLLNNNTIRQTPNGRGIEIIARNGTGGLDVTVTNNDVNPQDTSGFPLAAILVQSNCLTICNTVRSDVRGNTVPSATDVTDLLNTYLELVESSSSTLELVDTTAPISGTCATELAATNTGSTGVLGGCALITGPISTPP